MLRILSKIQRIGIVTEPLPKIDEPALEEIGAQLKAKVGEMFSGSLAIREVDAYDDALIAEAGVTLAHQKSTLPEGPMRCDELNRLLVDARRAAMGL